MPGGLISLEMDAGELGLRAFAREYEIDLSGLQSGNRTAIRELEARYDKAMRDWPVQLDTTSKTLEEVRARIYEWHHRHAVKLVVIDHLQLMRTGKAKRFDELAEISRTLKEIAMDVNTPVLALSQLSREVEREKRKPVLSDLRECGNIEQDADAVMFLHCQESKGQVNDAYSLLLAKNRGGPAQKEIALHVDGRYAKLGELMR